MWRYAATTFIQENNKIAIEPTRTLLSPTPALPEKTAEADGETYVYLRSEAFTPRQIKLVGNYTEKLVSEELMKSNNCKFGINGGFYDTKDQPLGWTVIEGKEVAPERISQLFNGYIGVTEDLLSVEATLPVRKVDSGLQTGPILIANGRVITLQMSADKNARRMVMTTDNRGNAIFFTFYAQMLVDSGPTLTLLPKLVQKAAEKENLNIRQAVNLDGGSASAFYGGELNLVESNPVGSWWCAH